MNTVSGNTVEISVPQDAVLLPPDADPAALRRLEKLAYLLDSAFRVPGTSVRFGLDAALGVVPVVGDLAAKAVSAWMLLEAWRLRLPPRLLGRMLGNLAIDAAVGAVPVVGDMADFFLKANKRNLKLIHDHLRLAPAS